MMPRRKRHKKHGKRRNKFSKNDTSKPTNVDNSLKEVSPLQTPSSRKKVIDNVNSTPVNSRGSVNRDRKLNYASMNVTNLNILFDTPKSTKEIRLNNSKVVYEVKTNADKSTRKVLEKSLGPEVNINPYLKNKDSNILLNSSYNELAFFSPKFFQHKSSTPIARIVSPQTPKLRLNLNFNNATLSDKVLNKDDSLRSLKKLKNVPQPKVCDKSQQCLLLRDVTCENVYKPGAVQRIVLWLKKCYKNSLGFPLKWKQALSQVFVRLKSVINGRNATVTTATPSCNCLHYRRDISNLKENVQQLQQTVENLTKQIEDYRNYSENIATLSNDLKKVKDEVMRFANIPSEFKTMKGGVAYLQPTPIDNIVLPLVPPPPPPPLPPPPTSFQEMSANKLKITRKNKSHSLDKDTCRPVISLDDILKVKLKKASERAYQTPLNRRSDQPIVSLDMLHRVKLRPASRASLRSETLESTLDSTTSPRSSLARFLKTDSPAARLKRLRKVSGYSHDSVYRRNLLKRERDNS